MSETDEKSEHQIPSHLLEPISDLPRSPNRAHAMALNDVFMGKGISSEITQAAIHPLEDKAPQLQEVIQIWNHSRVTHHDDASIRKLLIQFETFNELRNQISQTLAGDHAEAYLLHRELTNSAKSLFLDEKAQEFDDFLQMAIAQAAHN